MIFLDTNVFVEAFGRDASNRVIARETDARTLLTALSLGRLEATTSEAIVAEVTFVLTRATSPGKPIADVAAFLGSVLAAPGLRFGPKHIYAQALDLWTARPGLGFVDALTICYARQGDVQLASFDQQLLGSPGVTPYWADAEAPT